MKVFVGWDVRERLAFEVCRHSILSRTRSAAVRALDEAELRACGLFTRPKLPGERWDVLSGAPYATDFALTRFLVPVLMKGRGWALFCDADFLFTAPLDELFALADPSKAVMVVPHAFPLREVEKMDGRAQQPYPRKWWSALMLWNCGHPSNEPRAMLSRVNEWPGRDLHGFRWLADHEIGRLPDTWHWLEGYSEPTAEPPAAIHFTRGGPWFPTWQHVAHADLWRREHDRMAVSL